MSPFIGKRIGVLLGGVSSERKISLKTGASVLAALKGSGYSAVAIDAGKDLFSRITDEGVEAAFIALHGGVGEDGSVQGGLEVMGIPYTGSGVLASALAMDKIRAKEIFRLNSIPTPASSLCNTEEVLKNLNLPLVVKPSAGGSTLGLSIVKDASALPKAIELAGSFNEGILIEEYVSGREISVSVLDEEVFPVVEIFTAGELYDYKAKYTAGGASFKVPADMEPALTARVSDLALKSYTALGCRGAARVDILIGKGAEPFVLEVNTSPGLTERSLLPMAAEKAGLSYRDLVVRLLEGASLDSRGSDKIRKKNEKQSCQ